MANNKDKIRLIKKQLMNLFLLPFKLFPLKKNRIMLINSLSFKYAGNPRAIGDYLASHNSGKYDMFLAVNDVEKYAYLKGKSITPVKYCSLAYYFYAMTSKVIVSNSGGYSFLPKRKKQVIINTWHGGGAYKKGGLDVCENTPAYIKDVKLFSERTSLFLTTCTQQTDIFERAYMIPRERILEIGMPRNDMLFSCDTTQSDKIKEKLGFQKDEHIVLYAPTFRKQNDDQFGQMVTGNYDIDIDMVCSALSERFGGTWKFAYRLHPVISQRNMSQFENAVNLSDYEDMQDLLLITDVLINDYSSSMWDFMFTSRPCFIFATDIEHYMKTTSWYTPIEKWPFPVSQNNEQLREVILNFNAEHYRDKVSKHLKELGCCENGTATQQICKRIEAICHSN